MFTFTPLELLALLFFYRIWYCVHGYKSVSMDKALIWAVTMETVPAWPGQHPGQADTNAAFHLSSEVGPQTWESYFYSSLSFNLSGHHKSLLQMAYYNHILHLIVWLPLAAAEIKQAETFFFPKEL